MQALGPTFSLRNTLKRRLSISPEGIFMFTSAAVKQEVSFRPSQTNMSRGFSSWFKQHLALSQSISFPICCDKETIQIIPIIPGSFPSPPFRICQIMAASGRVRAWLHRGWPLLSTAGPGRRLASAASAASSTAAATPTLSRHKSRLADLVG